VCLLLVLCRRLLDYNQQRMPFAAAQVGLGFRNEIAPRNGLLRVREFCLAEIEHFVHPDKKDHPKFAGVAGQALVLFPREAQLTTGRTLLMTAGKAVAEGVIASQTLAYFMARSQLWLQKIGIDLRRLRFRQHLLTEMAHYATDCWDIEINTMYGWVECK
jgi:glycyl-tRNA synthetase